jgi:hypothetical protein
MAVAVQAAGPAALALPVDAVAIAFAPTPTTAPGFTGRPALDALTVVAGLAGLAGAQGQHLAHLTGRAGCDAAGLHDSPEAAPSRPREPRPTSRMLALAGLLFLAWRLRGHWGGGTAAAVGLCLNCSRALPHR